MSTNATKDIQTEANRHYASQFDSEMRDLVSLAMSDLEDEDGNCIDSMLFEGESIGRDQAIQRLEEMPLSFEKVITNHRRETIEYEILLGTGGPADRVYVITDFSGAIESAEYQFQDWFQPWTTAEGQDSELVERFAAIVTVVEEG